MRLPAYQTALHYIPKDRNFHSDFHVEYCYITFMRTEIIHTQYVLA
jgi:hypothetical protein